LGNSILISARLPAAQLIRSFARVFRETHGTRTLQISSIGKDFALQNSTTNLISR